MRNNKYKNRQLEKKPTRIVINLNTGQKWFE